MAVLCVGIDPAPSGRKGSAVVEFLAGEAGAKPRWRRSVSHPELREDLQRWRSDHESVVIAWDAPLTGPQDPDSNGAGHRRTFASDFTIREVEKELRSFLPDDSLGISVVGYAGCPHWTVTRNLLGLPRVGPFDAEWGNLPYRLLVSKPQCWDGHHAVEVHPAVAIWEWLRNSDAPCFDWRYKAGSRAQQRHICAQFIHGLGGVWGRMGLEAFEEAVVQHCGAFTESADLIDALVATALVALLVSDPQQVQFRGNLRSGAILLPADNAVRGRSPREHVDPSLLGENCGGLPRVERF